MSLLDLTPGGIALKLAPWALVGVMGLGLWGGYGYLKAAQQAAETAERERDVAQAKVLSLKAKAHKDGEMLAKRERERAAAQAALAALHKRTRGFVPSETCLSLDVPYLWIDQFLLPDGAAVQPSPDG